MTIDNTVLELDGRGELADGINNIEFDVSVTSMSSGADASGNGLWKLQVFTTNDFSGRGARRVLDDQTLSPSQASQQLTSGSRTTFRNLGAQIDRSQVKCDEDSYLCVELARGDRPSVDFTMTAAYDDSYISCEKLKCAKKLPCKKKK